MREVSSGTGQTARGEKMAGKIIIAVIAVVVVALVGVAVFVAINANNDKGDDTTYWFFVDYGTFEDSNRVSQWYSTTEGSNASEALKKALHTAGIIYEIDDNWIISIQDVEPIWTLTGDSWYTWPWKEVDSTWEAQTLGLSEAGKTIFYVAITGSGPAPDYTLTFDPNAVSYWKNAGPFAYSEN